MKRLLLLLITLFSLNAFTQNAIEISPNISNSSANSAKDSLNLFFSFPTTAFIGEYGVESNGSDIYVTQWRDDSIVKYNFSGQIQEIFTISFVEETRDLAWDGQYYYGSPNDFFFYVLDLENKTKIDQVYTSFKIRGMAYDAFENVLWATEMWDPMFHKMDMDGNIRDSWMASGITLGAISGLAYDDQSWGGPYLWGFSQDSSGAMLVKYDIASQSQTGNIIDVSGLVNENPYAGGLYLEDATIDNGPVIGGVIQNQLVFALDLNYANTLVGLNGTQEVIPLMEIYPNPVEDMMNVSVTAKMEGNYTFKIFNQAGQLIHNQTAFLSESNMLRIETHNLKAGNYFLQVSSEKGLSVTRKLIKE